MPTGSHLATLGSIALAGAAGCLLRFLVVSATASRLGSGGLPLGTMIANVLGCLLIGLIAAHFGRRDLLPDAVRFGVLVGLLGGFTTFSSFGWETVQLIEKGRTLEGACYWLGTNLLGLAAVVAGMRLAPLLDSAP